MAGCGEGDRSSWLLLPPGQKLMAMGEERLSEERSNIRQVREVGKAGHGKRVTLVSSCPYFPSPQEVSVRDFQERVLSW